MANDEPVKLTFLLLVQFALVGLIVVGKERFHAIFHERREITPDGMVVEQEHLHDLGGGMPGVEGEDGLDAVGMAGVPLAPMHGDKR